MDAKRYRESSAQLPVPTPAALAPIVPSGDLGTDQPPITEAQLATHVSTIHKDPIEHPIQTLSDILANRTLPNKFRVKAKVQAVHQRRVKGLDSYAQRHCGKCNHA